MASPSMPPWLRPLLPLSHPCEPRSSSDSDTYIQAKLSCTGSNDDEVRAANRGVCCRRHFYLLKLLTSLNCSSVLSGHPSTYNQLMLELKLTFAALSAEFLVSRRRELWPAAWRIFQRPVCRRHAGSQRTIQQWFCTRFRVCSEGIIAGKRYITCSKLHGVPSAGGSTTPTSSLFLAFCLITSTKNVSW